MALNFLQLAYDTVKDEWDLPDINYLKSLDGSNSSQQVLEDVAKEAARKMLAHFATIASNKLLEVLLQKLETLTLPDCKGKSQAAITEVDYEATNGRVSRASRPLSTVSVDGGNITWAVNDIGVQSLGDWKYNLAGGLLSDRGTYELSMNGMAFQFSANIVKVPGEAFDLQLGDCNFTRGQPDLQFGGSPGCMLLQCLFQDSVRQGLSEAIPQQVVDGVKELAMQTAPFLREFHAYWPLAMGVIQVTSDLVNSLTKGF
ncbi:hypothetical protein HELRODRAFT_190812 [Helobdella robusta]|uniref:Lipid-binding serum glycoprotein N-terminal domain-containing protein n=1 Tax=Helobdella robusta TaxID=6412 RepID=T1FSB2_HELRO|nr:hypothetical protein HELRODRAFT_190812 [Helobdella robusta]ESO07918.1 hypothetical protein HELRODRAFT_190812 [Helobdella robusta]